MKSNFKSYVNLLISAMTVMLWLININYSYSQTDSLHIYTGEIIVGELKEMKENVATINTSYSESDFKIKWNTITRLNTKTQFLVSLSSGKHYSGQLVSRSNEKIGILSNTDTLAIVSPKNIVFLRQLNNFFWSNLDIAMSLGFNYAKAKNLTQYSVRSSLGYRAKSWSATTNYNHIISTQDNVLTTDRLDANITYKYYFKRKWFGLGEVNWLSNTAQNVELRTLSKLGVGRYFIRTNHLYWGLQSGISYNLEELSSENLTENNSSSEAFIGTEINFYNIGDLNFLSRVIFYPSLTESNRKRIDLNTDVKYDLPLDFFVNLGLSLNYDNQPLNTTNNTDYVLQMTFGWSL